MKISVCNELHLYSWVSFRRKLNLSGCIKQLNIYSGLFKLKRPYKKKTRLSLTEQLNTELSLWCNFPSRASPFKIVIPVAKYNPISPKLLSESFPTWRREVSA